MTNRFHINPNTGKPGPCKPVKTAVCRYAEDGENPPHYENESEARTAYEKSMNEEIFAVVTNSPTPEEIKKANKDFEFRAMLFQDDPHSQEKVNDYGKAYNALKKVDPEAAERHAKIVAEAARMKKLLDTQMGNKTHASLNNTLLNQLEESRDSLPGQTLLWTDVAKYREIPDEYNSDIKKATLEKVTQTLAAEKDVTSILVSSKPEGAEFEKAFFRVKAPAAIASKIKRNLESKGIPLTYENSKKETDSMKDVLRYTYKVDETDELTNVIKNNARDFESKGFTCSKASNSFVDDVSFKGFVTTWKTPNGEEFELQYSTSAASAVKTEAHKQYEIARDESKSKEERKIALQKSKDIFSQVKNPRGIESITTIGGQKVSQWTAE